MNPTRRETIAAIGLAGLAGCTSSDSNGNDEASAEEPIEVGDSGGGVSIVRHHFEYTPDLGPELFLTIRNTRDAAIEGGEVFCRVYDGDALAGETYGTISMSPNETTELDLLFTDVQTDGSELGSTTHYEIIVDAPYKNGVTDEIQKEFDQPVKFGESTDEE
ncbi:hypothetical protein [Natrinema versiforme]|uniref:Uncharacterized protein n=1 Tax=Natrinema versiforme TaxID=88724 RepID=A0A4P8WM87_9EURY|nr:hypothetical protein [Natrinema versiforme]QCS44688.1 hypothetical protein FEJ81_20525 [Natrinema versiforme]